MRTRLALTAFATAFAAGAAATALLVSPSSTTVASTSADAVLSAAETATDSGATTTGPQGGQRKRLLTAEQRQQLRQTGHLTVTKDTKRHGTVAIAIQLGEVTAISRTSITLTSKDGYTHSYSISDKTKVRLHRQPAAVSDVTLGAKAAVFALVSPDGDSARRIIVRPARTARAGSGPARMQPSATNA